MECVHSYTMPSISKREHEQFLLQLSLFFPEKPRGSINPDAEMVAINKSLEKLEQLLASYQDGILHLQAMSAQYRVLMKNTKVMIRRYQLKEKYKTQHKDSVQATDRS